MPGGNIKTVAELGRALGISQKSASNLVRRDDWPFARVPPWPRSLCVRMRSWRLANLAEDPNPAQQKRTTGDDESALEMSLSEQVKMLSPLNQVRIRKIVEQTATIKFERELMAGGWLKKTDVDSGRLRRMDAVRRILQDLPARAAEFVGLDAVAMPAALEKWARSACLAFEHA